eukprot:TRINITY_DN1293_c0_g1_i2.p1 TRINITY_DN1293_c0_g1~~TRINITY_DN1293_c0_g1_i2.p1  ORF type:complete len:258 (+),score=79.52 TRINITY_DN1293_c0_g1_i2:55-828(+)
MPNKSPEAKAKKKKSKAHNEEEEPEDEALSLEERAKAARIDAILSNPIQRGPDHRVTREVSNRTIQATRPMNVGMLCVNRCFAQVVGFFMPDALMRRVHEWIMTVVSGFHSSSGLELSEDGLTVSGVGCAQAYVNTISKNCRFTVRILELDPKAWVGLTVHPDRTDGPSETTTKGALTYYSSSGMIKGLRKQYCGEGGRRFQPGDVISVITTATGVWFLRNGQLVADARLAGGDGDAGFGFGVLVQLGAASVQITEC